MLAAFLCYSEDMKTMQCYDCQERFLAASRDQMLQHFYDHYMEKHHEIITGADEVEKKRWMAQFETDWGTAENK